jgi:hypothetical protein
MSACYYSNNKVKLLDSAIMWFKVLIKESNKLDCYFSIRPNKFDCYFSIRPNKLTLLLF